jgi:SPP1 gp7 family putative phage head morphogenesis protein
LERFLPKLYSGVWSMEQLIPELYFHTAGVLLKAYEEGYEKRFFSPDWTLKDTELLSRVQNNLFAFSGAKCYAEMLELRDAVYQDGRRLPFNDYRRKALKINARYNVTYLEVERQAVLSAGAAGSRWVDIQESRDTHPYLTYVTAGDEDVREEHRKLSGITLSVDDPFWLQYYPPNGWRCRCYVRKLTQRLYDDMVKKKGTLSSSDEAMKVGGHAVDKAWRHNVGTSEIFEKDGSAYFKASPAAAEKQLSAVKHYGMKPARVIYGNPSQLATYKGGIATDEAYRRYWAKLEEKYGKAGEGFSLLDKGNGIRATFDAKLKEKMVERGRHTYFDEALEVLTKPDEVWAVFKGSAKKSFGTEFFNVYLKYYNDRPMVLLVNSEGRVDSFYKLESVEKAEEFRLGLLKQKR